MTIRLEPLLNNFFDDRMSDLFVCCAGVIVGIQNVGQLRVDVKPLNKKRELDNTITELPAIYNVPLVVTASDDGGLLVSPKQGQTVMLMFAHCDIDAFKGGATSPYESVSKRYLDMNDAIAVLGLTPFTHSPNNALRHYTVHDVEDVTVFNNLGTQRENKVICHKDGSLTILTQDKDVNIKAKDVNVEKDLNVDGDLYVKGDIDVKGDIIIKGVSLWDYMNQHTHPHTDDGSPMMTSPPKIK